MLGVNAFYEVKFYQSYKKEKLADPNQDAVIYGHIEKLYTVHMTVVCLKSISKLQFVFDGLNRLNGPKKLSTKFLSL